MTCAHALYLHVYVHVCVQVPGVGEVDVFNDNFPDGNQLNVVN